MMKTSYLIEQVSEQLTKLLLEKNKAYGDSATQGDTIFATEENKEITPIHTGLANDLVYDELATRRREGNGKRN